MIGIIDTHSHILPGLDDGASDMREYLSAASGPEAGDTERDSNAALFRQIS